MAFTNVAARGSAANKTTATSISRSPTATLTAGQLVLVAIAKDNTSTTSGDNSEVTSVVDSVGGNTWTKYKEHTNAGAAKAADTISLWGSILVNPITTSDTITANFASCDAKVICLMKADITAGSTVEVAGSDTYEVDGAAYWTSTDPQVTGLASQEYLGVVAVAIEIDFSPGTIAPYTSTGAATSGGGAASNIGGGLGASVFTGTSTPGITQSSGSSDVAAVAVALREVLANQTVSPGTGQVTATGFAPTVFPSNPQTVAPGLGQVTANGFAPSVVVNTIAAVGLGALLATGFAPTVNNGAFAPDSITGLRVWFDASQETGFSDNDPVGTWTDRSGNANDGTQATTANKPTFKTNILNGNPALRFATDDYLSTPQAQMTTSTFFVVYANRSGTNGSFHGGNGATAAAGTPLQRNTTVFPNDSVSFSLSPDSLNAKNIYQGNYDYSTPLHAVRLNNVANGSNSTATNVDTSKNITVGAGYGEFLNGDICEFIVYDSILSSTDRDLVYNYLADKYLDAPVIVSPELGQLTATGFAPEVKVNTIVSPAAGNLTATGFAPTVLASANQVVSPALGQLTATGFAPSALVNTIVGPDVGALTVTGFAPTLSITDSQNVLPGTGALSVTGFAPVVTASDHKAVSPDVGQLTVTGFEPTIAAGGSANLEPGTGAVTLEGFAPTVSTTANQFVAPALGQVTVTGFEPTVAATANQFVLPGTGEVTATGFAPVVAATANQFVEPGGGTVVVTGFAPTVAATANQFIAPDTGQVVITGFAPLILSGDAQVLQPGSGSLVATGFSPTVTSTAHVTLEPDVGTLTVLGFAPTILATDHQVVFPGTGTLTVEGFAPVVFATDPQTVEPGTGEVIVTGFAPVVQTAQPGTFEGTVYTGPVFEGTVRIGPVFEGEVLAGPVFTGRIRTGTEQI